MTTMAKSPQPGQEDVLHNIILKCLTGRKIYVYRVKWGPVLIFHFIPV